MGDRGRGTPPPHETLYLSGGKHIFHDDSRVSLSTDPTFLGLGYVWKVYRGTIALPWKYFYGWKKTRVG